MTQPKRLKGSQNNKQLQNRTNLLERHIQNILTEKLITADDKILADAIKTLLHKEGQGNKTIH
jgi:hypothetical protein